MYSVADLRPGQAIELEGTPYLVLEAQFGRKSQSKGNCVTRIRNLRTGAVIQKTFIGSDKIPAADVGFAHVQFLYTATPPGTQRREGVFTFMDLQSYEQFELKGNVIGEAERYLRDGLELDVLVFDEKPIAVRMPVTVDLQVTETTPGVKGDTATGGTKQATLETGLTLNVPLFIHEGDILRINTERGEYVERA